MKVDRREFVGVVGASLASVVIPAVGRGSPSVGGRQVIEKNGWQMKVAPTGDIISLRKGMIELVIRALGDN